MASLIFCHQQVTLGYRRAVDGNAWLQACRGWSVCLFCLAWCACWFLGTRQSYSVTLIGTVEVLYEVSLVVSVFLTCIFGGSSCILI